MSVLGTGRKSGPLLCWRKAGIFLHEFPHLSFPAYPAAIDQRTLQEETALYLATCRGHLDCLQSLLQAGAEPDISNKSRETPLYKGEHPGVSLPEQGSRRLAGQSGALLLE